MLTGKHELNLDRAYVNSTGFLGFAPDTHAPDQFDYLGAFITNPISVKPRTPARLPRLLEFPGGFLMHTGHPNPGLRGTLKQHQRQWGRSPIPIIVHLLAEDPATLARAMQTLERVDTVMGVEIGLPPGIDDSSLREFANAALGELPFILRLPLEDAPYLVLAAETSGAAAISLGPPRGNLPGPEDRLISGRLYGAATFPLALEAVARLGPCKIPIIAGGGIRTPADAEAFLMPGPQL